MFRDLVGWIQPATEADTKWVGWTDGAIWTAQRRRIACRRRVFISRGGATRHQRDCGNKSDKGSGQF